MAKETDTSEHEQQYMDGTEPPKIPAIDRASKAFNGSCSDLGIAHQKKKEKKEKLREVLEEHKDQLFTREEKGETIHFYTLKNGQEAILEAKKDEAKVAKSKAPRKPDEPEE